MTAQERPTRLLGGPHDGVRGVMEQTPPPVSLAFGENGGFVYTLVSDPRRKDKPLTYRYNPAVSPAHALVLQADREAIVEVALTQNKSIAQVLAEARVRREAAARAGHPKPAEALFAEAERQGVSPEVLLAQGFDLSSLFPTEGDADVPAVP